MWIDRSGSRRPGRMYVGARALPFLQRRRRRQRRPAGHHEGVPARRHRGGRQPEPAARSTPWPCRSSSTAARVWRRWTSSTSRPASSCRPPASASRRSCARPPRSSTRACAPSTAGSRRTGATVPTAVSTARRCCRCSTSTQAIAELERLLARGARFAILTAGPFAGPLAGRSVLRSVLGALRGGRARTSSTTSAARPSARCTTRPGACARTRRRTAIR